MLYQSTDSFLALGMFLSDTLRGFTTAMFLMRGSRSLSSYHQEPLQTGITTLLPNGTVRLVKLKIFFSQIDYSLH